MGKYDALLDHRPAVIVVVEDYLGGVKSWATRIRKVYEGHPEFNVLMLEVPVYAKTVTGSFHLCAPTLDDVYDVLSEIRPAIVVPNYAWEVFGVCARLIDEGVPLRTVGFCRTDEEVYYGPLQWFEPIIAQFVCVSPECAQKLGERIPQRRADIHVLPTGVVVPPALDRAYQTAPVRVAYGGRMSQVQKRVWDFLPLARALLDRKVDFQLDLVGSGSQTEKLKAAMAEVPHGGRVRFHDPVAPDAMLDIWAAHDIFVQVSEYEGTSNSMLESMAFGAVPVVTDATSGIRGVIEEGRNGFIVPVGDMEAMAQRIADLAQSAETLERLGRAAFESSKRYSIENYEKRFSEILRGAASAPVRGWARDEIFSAEVYGLIRRIKRRRADSRPFGDRFPTPFRRPPQLVPGALPGASGSGGDPIVLAAAADDHFVLPLAVMVRSVLASLGADRRLELFVLDGGITGGHWEQLRESWNDPRLTVRKLDPDLDVLRGMKTSGHITTLAYCRFLIPAMLPPEYHKAIYLDSDLIVLRDLAELWDTPMGDRHLLAVQDLTMPYIDSNAALPNLDRCGPYLSQIVALPPYRQFNIPAAAPYFNAGLLVINLDRWRADGTAEAILNFVEDHKDLVRYHDQDGLNAVLHDKWAMLDLRWNQIPHIYRYPSAEDSPFDRGVFEQVRDDPWIVHYATRSKPWQHDNVHPARDLFFTFVDQTAWAGWRPATPVNHVRNPELRTSAENIVAEWKSPLGGKFAPAAGPAPDIPGLRIEIEELGKNAQLVQEIVRDSSASVTELNVSIQGKCDEAGCLGLNVYAWIGGVARTFSQNHPGDRVWRKLSHELSFESPPERIQVLVVLRGAATKPAFVAAPAVSFGGPAHA